LRWLFRRLPPALRSAPARAALLALAFGLAAGCGFSGEPDPVTDECVAGRACSSAGLGACAEGVTRCPGGPEGAVECAPVATGTEEVCDAVDNDCDGRTDEGLPDDVTGSDVGRCQPRILSCRDGVIQEVQSAIGPAPELCGDGIDQDCDGSDCNAPPLVRLVQPEPGSDLVEGTEVYVRVEASDEDRIDQVVLLLDGSFAGSQGRDPYEFEIDVPRGSEELTLEAVARDSGGLEASTGALRYAVIEDPGTDVAGRVVDELGDGVGGAVASIVGVDQDLAAETERSGEFVIRDVPSSVDEVEVVVRLAGSNAVVGRSDEVPAVPGGTTEVGKIEVRTLFFDEDFGRNLDLDDDESERIDFDEPFRFPFYGKVLKRAFVNANGTLTFDSGDDTRRESLGSFVKQPAIAALFDALDPDDDDAGVFVRERPDRLVVTWFEVEESRGDNTFQVVLREDGRIVVVYERMRVRDGLVGITPGGGDRVEEVDFDDEAPFTSESDATIYEQFTGFSGRERFDLRNAFLVFRPRGDGRYAVDVVPFSD